MKNNSARTLSVHFFADTAPLRREITSSRVFWRTQKNDEVFFLLFILNAVSNTLTPGIRPDLTC